MESQSQEPPKAPPRRRPEERYGQGQDSLSSISSGTSTIEFDGTEHPALRAQEFHRLHRSAIEITAEGQTADADGRRDEAFKAYSRSLHFIDQAVSLAHQGGFPDSDVNRIDDLTYKLRITRKQILERVSDLQTGGSSSQDDSYLQGPASGVAGSISSPSYLSIGSASSVVLPRNPLPSYEDALRAGSEPMAGTSTAAKSVGSKTNQGFNYRDLVSALDDIAAEQSTLMNPLPLNAHEVFSISQNVQIYYISVDDNVSAPSYPSFLRVVVTDHGELKQITPIFKF